MTSLKMKHFLFSLFPSPDYIYIMLDGLCVVPLLLSLLSVTVKKLQGENGTAKSLGKKLASRPQDFTHPFFQVVFSRHAL